MAEKNIEIVKNPPSKRMIVDLINFSFIVSYMKKLKI